MTANAPLGLIATNDVGSHLETARSLLTNLATLSDRNLLLDAGGFFGTTGYYRAGGGRVEREILARFYDALVPGGPGFGHYLDDMRLRERAVCANLFHSATPVFRPFLPVTVSGVRCLLTGIVGADAFDALAPEERAGIGHRDPVEAIYALTRYYTRHHPEEHRALIVLSHSGWEHDLALAKACPHLTAIFSGYCHHAACGPVGVGNVLVVKGPEHGAGHAAARFLGTRWSATSRRFPAGTGQIRASLTDLHTEIAALTDRPADHAAEPHTDTAAPGLEPVGSALSAIDGRQRP